MDKYSLERMGPEDVEALLIDRPEQTQYLLSIIKVQREGNIKAEKLFSPFQEGEDAFLGGKALDKVRAGIAASDPIAHLLGGK
jgi:hypothetical protein